MSFRRSRIEDLFGIAVVGMILGDFEESYDDQAFDVCVSAEKLVLFTRNLCKSLMNSVLLGEET